MRTPARVLSWLAALGLVFGLGATSTFADDAKVAPAKPAAESKKEASGIRKPFLWVVDSKPRIYLFGTIHVGDPRVLAHPPVVQKALDDSGVLFTEIDMAEMNPAALAPRIILPGAETLKTALKPALFERLQKELPELGIPLISVMKMKPFVVFFRLQLAGMDAEQAKNPALDMSLFAKAKERGRVVGGLETVEEQLGIFDALSYDEQGQLIEATLDAMALAKKTKAPAPLQGMIQLYLEGDLDKMMAAVVSPTDQSPLMTKLMRQILDERNVRMADRMVERLKDNSDKAHFIAVGAAHYGGKTGILALLRKKGYQVWRATTLEDLKGPPAKPTVSKETRPAAGGSTASPSSRRRPGRISRRHVRIGPFCIPVRRCCPRR